MTVRPAARISITLSARQVRQVLRATAREGAAAPGAAGAAGVRAGGSGRADFAIAPDAVADRDPRLSRSLLRGLALLARFGPDTPERGIVELADELALPPSTAHRYAVTLVEAGLLERVPRTRRYRLARV